jgi:hypothetical protein
MGQNPIVSKSAQRVYEVRPRVKINGRQFDSGALPFGRLWYVEPNAISNASDTPRFVVEHIALWFAFTMKRAT